MQCHICLLSNRGKVQINLSAFLSAEDACLKTSSSITPCVSFPMPVFLKNLRNKLTALLLCSSLLVLPYLHLQNQMSLPEHRQTVWRSSASDINPTHFQICIHVNKVCKSARTMLLWQRKTSWCLQNLAIHATDSREKLAVVRAPVSGFLQLTTMLFYTEITALDNLESNRFLLLSDLKPSRFDCRRNDQVLKWTLE